LWQCIAAYATSHRCRYLIGCSSLNTQDAAVGASAHAQLARRHLAPAALQTRPLPGWECPLDRLSPGPASIPKLLRAYLGLGAKICAPPALDREFKTVDFLTLLDLHALPEEARRRFLRA
jgi:putative hemolysin